MQLDALVRHGARDADDGPEQIKLHANASLERAQIIHAIEHVLQILDRSHEAGNHPLNGGFSAILGDEPSYRLLLMVCDYGKQILLLNGNHLDPGRVKGGNLIGGDRNIVRKGWVRRDAD